MIKNVFFASTIPLLYLFIQLWCELTVTLFIISILSISLITSFSNCDTTDTGVRMTIFILLYICAKHFILAIAVIVFPLPTVCKATIPLCFAFMKN